MSVVKWMDLSEKVVIVTGGSLGIGEHVVENLRANNAKVVIADLAPNEKFVNDENILFVKCNVAKKADVESLVKSSVNKFGKIDAIINNAGVSRPRMLVDYYGQKPQYELSEDDLDFMYNVNQKGVVLCAQAAARQMIKQKSGGGNYKYVFTSRYSWFQRTICIFWHQSSSAFLYTGMG